MPKSFGTTESVLTRKCRHTLWHLDRVALPCCQATVQGSSSGATPVLLGMDSQEVWWQWPFLPVLPGAVRTLEGRLACVSPIVRLKVRGVGKCHMTMEALKWPLARVHSLVGSQVSLSCKGRLTEVAAEGWLVARPSAPNTPTLVRLSAFSAHGIKQTWEYVVATRTCEHINVS